MSDRSGRPGRCAAAETEDGTVRIYDTENEAAWIQSDAAVSIAWQT